MIGKRQRDHSLAGQPTAGVTKHNPIFEIFTRPSSRISDSAEPVSALQGLEPSNAVEYAGVRMPFYKWLPPWILDWINLSNCHGLEEGISRIWLSASHGLTQLMLRRTPVPSQLLLSVAPCAVEETWEGTRFRVQAARLLENHLLDTRGEHILFGGGRGPDRDRKSTRL